ncbi:MAG TPA: hypothetical protein VHV77_09880, partial [Pirellulales bacterium]|nr:hypothetical protein [Pirellulales bacterium]
YIEQLTPQAIERIGEDIGDASVVIKTHSGLTPATSQLLTGRGVRVFASYRDPRDVALSLLDHGARSRKLGIKDFATFHTVRDTIPLLRTQVRLFRDWAKFPGTLIIPYDEISFNTQTTISRVADHLGVSVDVDRIFVEFDSAKDKIVQFNKGVRSRHKTEMDEATNEMFLNMFKGFYAAFFASTEAGGKTVSSIGQESARLH